MRKNLIIPFTLAFTLGLAGCQSGESDSAADGAESTAELQGTVLARVNGEAITESMLQQHVDQRTGGRGGELSPEMKRNLLNELVDMTLMAQAAKDEGYADDPQVQARLESIRRAVLAQAMVEGMDPQNAVTDEELQSAYEEQYTVDAGKEYHARHILLEDEAKAKELIAELQGGADFAALAQEHSTGPTGEKGGDLGWFAPDQMVPPFAEATRALEKGGITEEPVKTRFGWHVIKLEDVRDAQPPALAEVEDQLRSQLARTKIEDRLDSLRTGAEIAYTDNAPEGIGEADAAGAEEGSDGENGSED
ncbi:peptidylprolyl isomerase [Ectothiorhodospiraceae bacterium WFHF3C12]|nr:peptidylprolyl isomerase [Ectothiorhodospiraceae bacterium WFHF3C12]